MIELNFKQHIAVINQVTEAEISEALQAATAVPFPDSVFIFKLQLV